jgi:hypothetical protein
MIFLVIFAMMTIVSFTFVITTERLKKPTAENTLQHESMHSVFIGKVGLLFMVITGIISGSMFGTSQIGSLLIFIGSLVLLITGSAWMAKIIVAKKRAIRVRFNIKVGADTAPVERASL